MLLKIRSKLKFIAQMIIVPHPKISIPPSTPDPHFRVSQRMDYSPYASPVAASFLTRKSLPLASNATPQKSPLLPKSYATSPSISPCHARSATRFSPSKTLDLSNQVLSGKTPVYHGRSLRRIKGRVTRISPTKLSEYSSYKVASPPIQALNSTHHIGDAGEVQLTPIIESRSSGELSTIIVEDTECPVVADHKHQIFGLHRPRSVSTDQHGVAPTSLFCSSSLYSHQLDIPSVMLTIPTPEIPSLSSFGPTGALIFADARQECASRPHGRLEPISLNSSLPRAPPLGLSVEEDVGCGFYYCSRVGVLTEHSSDLSASFLAPPPPASLIHAGPLHDRVNTVIFDRPLSACAQRRHQRSLNVCQKLARLMGLSNSNDPQAGP